MQSSFKDVCRNNILISGAGLHRVHTARMHCAATHLVQRRWDIAILGGEDKSWVSGEFLEK